MSPVPAPDRGPDVGFPPPVLFVAGFGAGVLVDRAIPAAYAIAATFPLELAGIVLGVTGLGITYSGIVTFRRARTAVYPNRPASRVVDHGVYAYTRNPMYLGLILLYVGGGLLLPSLGALLMLPVVLVLLHRLVIAREERHLQAAFPEEYGAYRARVRRWC